MISPLDVYLVMQLDTIGTVFFILTLFLCLALFISLFIVGVSTSEDEKGLREAAIGMAKTIAPYFFAVLLITAILPSSKTAAAIILVPKLTSEEVMQPVGKEMGELYDLAKSALKHMADSDCRSDKRE